MKAKKQPITAYKIYTSYLLFVMLKTVVISFSVFLHYKNKLIHIINSWLNSIRQSNFFLQEKFTGGKYEAVQPCHKLDALAYTKFHTWWKLKEKKKLKCLEDSDIFSLTREVSAVFFRIPVLNTKILPHLHFDPSVLFLNLTLAPKLPSF